MIQRIKALETLRPRSQRTPRYFEQRACNPAVCRSPSGGETEWYPPVMIGAEAIARRLTSTSRYVESIVSLLERLETDAYCKYLHDFYRDGLGRFGDSWGYADIATTLVGLTELLRPRRYLEIGVRRGRSVCVVAAGAPDAELVMFDMWITNYAGMDNPGPEFVENELVKIGHRGKRTFISGNSHETVPRYFAQNPGAFDLITVDGDHSDAGAIADLCDVLPHLSLGGAIVFDDVCHPQHPGLRTVWQELVAGDPRFAAFTYDEVGYGVGFAVRKW